MSTVTVPTSLGGTGTTYRSDDGANGMASDGGYGYTSQDLLFEMLGEVITANQTAVTASAGATNAANVNGTSNTNNVAVGTGSKTLVYVEANRAAVFGMWVQATDAADEENYIHGQVTAYSGNNLTLNSTTVGGSGTPASWVISLSAPPGPAGAGSGDVTGPASAAADGNVALFDGTGGKTIKDGGTRAAWLAAGINGATGKTTPVDADELALIDSAASNVLKKLTWANLKATLWVALGPAIAAFTSKASPVGADEFAITDSAASGATKRVSLTNIAAFLASLSQTLTNKTLTSPVITGGTNDTFGIGFKEVPANSQSAAYTAVLADSGKSIDHPSTDANARTFTIPANASVAYPVGTCLSFSNMTSQVVTIAITSDTLYLAGTGTTGSRSLAQYGVATARKLTSTTWLISGVGLT